MRSFITYVSFAILALVGFTATAAAATAITPDDSSLLDLAKPVFDAVMHGQYWIAASLALVFACAATKRYGATRWKFWASKPGTTLLLLGMSFGGALATTLAGPGVSGLSGAMLLTAGKVALVAAGGYAMISSLIAEPILASKWYQEKAPAWLKPIVSLLLWAFTKSSTAAEKQAEATKAGDAAVTAAPGPGAEGIVGKPTEI